MSYKIGQNVVDFSGDVRYGWVRRINHAEGEMDVQFHDNGQTLIYKIDDEFVMLTDDWNRAGRDLEADERCEQLFSTDR